MFRTKVVNFYKKIKLNNSNKKECECETFFYWNNLSVKR